MSEVVAPLDADLTHANAAKQQLAAALSQQHASPTDKPGDLNRARAAVAAAEAALAAAEAAVRADQVAPHIAPAPHHITDTVT